MTKLRGLCGTGAVLLCLGISGCGGDSSPTATPTPTPVPTPPPPVVVLDGNFALRTCAPSCSVISTRWPFSITSTGTIDATVNYSHDDSNMTVFIAVGPCSFDQFVANQCTFAAEGFIGKPLKVSATGQTAGAYTLVIVNRGPNDEQIAFQVVFTAQAAATTNLEASRRPTGHGLGAVRLVPAP